MQRIWTIQYLRAVAALAVVAFHVSVQTGNWFSVGAFGVDLFFVVSGFIMWVLTNERRDRRGFVVDRLARVVPAYWCVSVISAAGAALVPRLFLAEGPPSWEHVVTSLLFLPVHYYPVVPQGWTLNIEMFFYALFAATLGLPRRAQLIVLSVMLAGFVLLGMAFHPQGGIGNTYFNTRLLEFIGGLWIGEFWLRGMGTDARLGIGAVLGGLILAPLLQWWRPELITFSWAFPAMLIVAGALVVEQCHAVPRIRIAALTGDASYLIYLIHIPIVQVLVELHWLPVSLLLVTAMLLCIAVSIALLPVERLLIRRVRSMLRLLVDNPSIGLALPAGRLVPLVKRARED